jgi:tripartite-type tricarboxylate transporter receptor subunit TctC
MSAARLSASSRRGRTLRTEALARGRPAERAERAERAEGIFLGEPVISRPIVGAPFDGRSAGEGAIFGVAARIDRNSFEKEYLAHHVQPEGELMKFLTLVRAALFVALGLAAGANDAFAQPYPTRPIRFIVPFPPGGLTDVFVRSLGNEMQKSLGQSVVVDNRPGANQIIGADACAKAPPDGYTLCLIGTDTHSFNPYLFSKLPYDPGKDIAPVAPLFFLVEGVIINPALNVNTMGELVALSKERPGLLNFGSFGQGSALQLFMEWFKHSTGATAVHVPYKGGAPLVQGLLTNEIQMVHFGLGNVPDHLKSGRLKLLAVSSSERSAMFPAVPTLVEAGIGQWPARNWFGVGAPAGTAPAVLEKLNAEINRVLAMPEFRNARMTTQALEPMNMNVRAFGDFLVRDRRNAAEIVKLSGIAPQ